MPRLFWANFDFEHELADPGRWQPPLALRQLAGELAAGFSALAEPGDVVAAPISVPTVAGLRFVTMDAATREPEFAGPEWELVPWGVTASLPRLADRRRWRFDAPPADLVRDLNDRVTSAALEQTTGTLPPGAAVVRSREELQAALGRLDSDRWVVKARWGMSGRERILGRGSELTPAHSDWAVKRLAAQGALILEPWLTARAEAGIQLDVPRNGAVRVLGVVPLLSSPRGEYLGSRLNCPDHERPAWEPAVTAAQQAAAAWQQQGYFGPLGFDAMQYDASGTTRLRPFQDINARWTMGRLAWEFRRRLGPNEDALWLQGRAARDLLQSPRLPPGTRLIPTSADPTGRHPSALLVGALADVDAALRAMLT